MNGNKPQEECHRGHRLIEPNAKPGSGGGRRCRSCECALSAAHNALHRKGELWTAENVQDYADLKYSELSYPPYPVDGWHDSDSPEYAGISARS